jgi:hypothetical protein
MRIKPKVLRHIELATLLACALLLIPVVAAALDSRCSVRIEVQLNGSVSNPRDPRVFTTLIANPAYSVSWVEGKGARHVFDLSGPGGDFMCRDGVEMLRRDPAIWDVRVIETERKGSN